MTRLNDEFVVISGMLKHRLAIVRRGAWVAASIAISWSALRADTVQLASGRTLENVEVVSAKWDSVQYRQGSGPVVTQTGAQVLSVERKGVILDRLRQLIDSGDLVRAQETLKTVPANQPGVLAESMYLLAQAYQRAGKLKEAIQAYQNYLAKFKTEKDWFVPYATRGLADCSLALDQPASAREYYKELAGFGPRWELDSKLGQAFAMLKEKGAASALEARRLLDEVLRSRSATLELRQKALVGRARAFLLQGQNDQVVKELSEGMFDSPKPEELVYSAERAEASLLMGRAYMAMGGKENLEQAEIWLLRVPALYGRQTNVYAEACDALVEVYTKLNNPTRAAEWKRRKGAGAGG